MKLSRSDILWTLMDEPTVRKATVILGFDRGGLDWFGLVKSEVDFAQTEQD